jgi:perosamine synthetase
MKIPLSLPDIGEREIAYVTDALRSGQLSLGARLGEFENKFAGYVGARYAVAVNSGTSALHLCVRAMDIGPGDEVITTSFSFVASVNCLLYEDVNPVFADIDPETLNIDPRSIREIIARGYRWDPKRLRLVNLRTGGVLKAILPVHVFGQPCDVAALTAIAQEFNLEILEDACEAVGAEFRGRPVGTFGDAAVFAFYPNKQMTTAEGGMIVTNNRHLAEVCRSERNQGRDDDSGWLRHSRLGFNYRLSELHCALGLAQLERIEEMLAERTRVAAEYARALGNAKGIVIPASPSDSRRSWFAYVIQLQGNNPGPERDRLISGLRERGIGCQAYFPPIHEQPYFREFELGETNALPNTELAAQRCLALPLFSTMTSEQVAEVCAAVRQILSEPAAKRAVATAAGTITYAAAAASGSLR